MTRVLDGWIAVAVLMATTAVASAQTVPPKPEDKPKTLARYKIWKGLFSRVEYRHDQADENVFRVRSSGATSKAQDTITVALHYLLF